MKRTASKCVARQGRRWRAPDIAASSMFPRWHERITATLQSGIGFSTALVVFLPFLEMTSERRRALSQTRSTSWLLFCPAASARGIWTLEVRGEAVCASQAQLRGCGVGWCASTSGYLPESGENMSRVRSALVEPGREFSVIHCVEARRARPCVSCLSNSFRTDSTYWVVTASPSSLFREQYRRRCESSRHERV